MRARPRVLVVDDDRLLRLSLRHTLVRDGFTVDLASRVSEAIDLLARAAYDLLVLDLRLPDGSGKEILRWAQDLDPRAAVLVLTGSADDLELEELAREGVSTVLIKPCKLAEVSREAGNAVAGREDDGVARPGDPVRRPPSPEV